MLSGFALPRGRDGVERDVSRGVFLLEQAIEAGSPDAMTGLGLRFLEGDGIEQDISRVSLLEQAIEAIAQTP